MTCRMMVCGKTGGSVPLDLGRALRVATKFPNIASRYFKERGVAVELIFVQGSVELAPLTGLADVIVDIVVNHLENLYYFDGLPNDGAPFRFHTGEYSLFPRDPAQTYVDFPVNNTWYPSGQYCDVFGDDGYVRVDPGGGSFWESDLHHNGDLNDYGDPWQNHLGKIYGTLDDVRTTHPRVQDKIIAMLDVLIKEAEDQEGCGT